VTQPTRTRIVVHEGDAWEAALDDRADPGQDRLTGLASQSLFVQRLEAAVGRSGTPVAILFADIDRFKAIAETHGQQIGERLLVAVAGRMRRLMRPEDTLARLQHDTFVILCEDPDGVAAVEALAARVDEALNGVFAVGAEVSVSCTVGMPFSGCGEDIPVEILHEIEMAINQAKRESSVDADTHRSDGSHAARPTGQFAPPGGAEPLQ